MKKNFFYATMSAIALTSAIGFTACSSDDAATDVNPTYDGNSVKTQFSISFPENVASTRMTSTTVQEAQTVASFRGMTNIVLIPYSSATDRETRLGDNITLAAGKMIQPTPSTTEPQLENSIPSGKLLENNNAVLFQDVTIPLGTSGFLFYGKATGADGYDYGALTPSAFTGEATTISFSPKTIVESITSTKGATLATYVTNIAKAADATDADITWAACANPANSDKPWYSENLGQLYTNFTSLKAGASAYVQAVVQDLYTSIKDNTDKVSVAIKTQILNSTYASDNDGILTFTAAISGYPGGDNNSMPDGTAVLSWNNGTATAATSGAVTYNVQDMAKIVFPASLYYHANSGVKVSNSPMVNEYKAENTTWGTILGQYTDGSSVTAATRSVAINDPIQYAVGRLDVSVAALSSTDTYYDREGKEMTIPAGAFTLNGVLIGGQKSVDYKFEPNGTTEYVIYDKTINTDKIINTENNASAVLGIGTAIGPTYTLALETAENQAVYVALEFVNNSGKDFRGVDGIVKNGCKFYMVATLDPQQDKPGEVSGVSSTGNKVFKQDFKTIANFRIGTGTADGNHDGTSDTPGGFANAYTTIPDLRTPELELGFSVNLSWQAGITFNVQF